MTVVDTDIAEIVFKVRKEANPCSLCSRMRRGALNEEAVRLGANKVALGHNFDDAVETFMLNLFFEGRIGCFSPVTYLSRMDLRMIRPMIYMPEKDVRYFTSKTALPVVTSPCPADGNTQREEMKQLIKDMKKKYDKIDSINENILATWVHAPPAFIMGTAEDMLTGWGALPVANAYSKLLAMMMAS